MVEDGSPDQSAQVCDRLAAQYPDRIRVIHGYTRGTALRDFIRSRYRHHPKVLRVEAGLNPGATDLVLREY